jgi:hypothetical protein
LRAARRRSSSSPVAAAGSVFEVATRVRALVAVATPSMPPGRVPTIRASPPAAGSSQSAAGASSSLASSPPGSGRAETNSTSPSGVKAGARSPLVLRVSRRAGAAPDASISQSAFT